MKHLFMAWLVVATIVLVRAQTGIVTGTVRRAGGPAASARVVIDSASDSTYTASTTTNADGRFTVAEAPVGAIGVKVYDAKGQLIAQTRGVLSHAGDTLTLMVVAP
jgi:ABC-type phosphate transport system permease subunit